MTNPRQLVREPLAELLVSTPSIESTILFVTRVLFFRRPGKTKNRPTFVCRDGCPSNRNTRVSAPPPACGVQLQSLKRILLQTRRYECPRSSRDHHSNPTDVLYRFSASKLPRSMASPRTLGDASSAPHRRPIGTPSAHHRHCLLYTSPSPRDKRQSRMPSSA